MRRILTRPLNAHSIHAFVLTVPIASVTGAFSSAATTALSTFVPEVSSRSTLRDVSVAPHRIGTGDKQVATPVVAPVPERAAFDKRMRDAFTALTAAQKKDVVDFFELEASHLQGFQTTLIAWVLKQQDRDPLDWHELPKTTYFDPVLHAPAQPIARTWLDPKSAQASKARSTFRAGPVVGAIRRAFVYDYGTGEIVRVTAEDESTRVFENALAGHPRRLDLAMALVERMLDDGAEQKSAAAFAHAYTDRSGHAFPGITLFDAYRSGAEIEMPDVDTLGVVHTLFDDWKTWTAPVPGPQQEALYDKIGEVFLALNRHVSLRRALAATYFEGSAHIDDGYAATIDNLHALWEECESTPEKLRARLPAAKDTPEFLSAWVKRCYAPDGPFEAGRHRHAVLDECASAVRATLERVMTEYGAFATHANAHPTTETPKKQAEVPPE